MKTLLLSTLLLGAFSITASAQGFIISGRIVDARNKPVDKVSIQAVGANKLGYGNVDKDGLYYTNEVPAGKYEIVILVDKTPYISQLTIAPTDPKKRFYNFKLQGKKAILTVSDKDVFMETALAKVRNDPNSRIDGLPGRINTIHLKHPDTAAGNK